MTAPRWIAEALEHAAPAGVMGTDAEALAAALLERLPLEAIAREVPGALDDIADGMHDRVVADIVRVLTDGDPDIVTLTEFYQSACKALDDAGVPYAINTAELYRPLDLAGRIRWLAEQRPTRLELQRVEARVDAELAAKQKAIDDAAPIMAALVLATQTAEQQRDAWHRRYDECIVTITANQQSIAALIDESETRRREVEATRRQATAAADDLDHERRAHQDAMGDAAATELRLQTTIGANAQELDLLRRQISDLQDQVEEHATREDEREAAHEHETGDLRRRFDDLQRDRDRLARDLNQIQGDLDTAERKLRDAERDLARTRHPGSW